MAERPTAQSESEPLRDGDSLNIMRCPACARVMDTTGAEDSPFYCNGYDSGPIKADSRVGGMHPQREMQPLTVEVMVGGL